MLYVAGRWGAWEVDTDAKRVRWLGLHDDVDQAAMPRELSKFLTADGEPRCEAIRNDVDGWATYSEMIRCEVGGNFVVRWTDGGIMRVPTRLTEVVEVTP